MEKSGCISLHPVCVHMLICLYWVFYAPPPETTELACCTYKQSYFLSGKICVWGGGGASQWERKTEVQFFQASRRYLNSAGRPAVCNGDESRIAITQSRQSVKYAFFSFILHHLYETSVWRQDAKPSARALRGWQIYY